MPDDLNSNDLTLLVNAGASRQAEAREVWADRYAELHALAGKLLSRESAANSLQPTALVHEAYVRMIDRERVTEEGTVFFKSCFSTECRRILVDRARARLAIKRGGGAERQTLSDVDAALDMATVDVLELSDAIEALAAHKARLARIVDMRIFGGLTVAECARELGVTSRTVDNDWAFARAWLRSRIAGDGAS